MNTLSHPEDKNLPDLYVYISVLVSLLSMGLASHGSRLKSSFLCTTSQLNPKGALATGLLPNKPMSLVNGGIISTPLDVMPTA